MKQAAAAVKKMTTSSGLLFFRLLFLVVIVEEYRFILLYSNFYFARGDTNFPFKVSVFTVLCNILISIFFFKKFGFLAIAAGTTISCWFAVVTYKYYLRKDKFHLSDKIFLERLKLLPL